MITEALISRLGEIDKQEELLIKERRRILCQIREEVSTPSISSSTTDAIAKALNKRDKALMRRAKNR